MKLNHLLTLSAAVLGMATAAHAQVVTPNPAPTIITSVPAGGYNINTPGFYQLGANLGVTDTSGNIININVGNVTLDFGGHYITGPSDNNALQNSTLVGVYVAGKGNVIIQNGTIAYTYQGIKFDTGAANINQRVNNMLITYAFRTGIFLNGTAFARITNNAITNVGGSQVSGFTNCGIQMNEGSAIEISNNSFSSNNTAVYNPGGSATSLAVGNKFYNCGTGLSGVTKYEDNLTTGTATPFTGGTAVGSNN